MNHAMTHADSGRGTSRRGFLGLALGATATGLLTACSSASGSPSTVKILNTSATAAIALNHLLTSGKYFDKVGVTAQISNLSSGNQVLGGTQVVSTSALFSGNPQIQSVSDLKGKTLGVGAVGSELYDVFTALLAKYGISRSEVTFRNVGSSADSLKAALAKQIDCGYGQVGDEPLAAQHGVRMIAVVSKELPLWINQGAVASAKAISSKRGTLVKALAAYANLFSDLSKPQSKSPYVAAYIAAGGTQAAGVAEWEYVNQNTAYSPTLDLPADKIRFVQQQNVDAGSQKQVLAYNNFTDLTLRTDALALAK
jgi:hypothetical protein